MSKEVCLDSGITASVSHTYSGCLLALPLQSAEQCTAKLLGHLAAASFDNANAVDPKPTN